MLNLIIGILLVLQVIVYGWLSGAAFKDEQIGKMWVMIVVAALLAFVGAMNFIVYGMSVAG